MTFLEIAQRIRQECGIPGSGPTTLVGQTGELKRVVDWMAAAYQDIQSKHLTWDFLRKEFTFSCVVGTDVYGETEHGITNLSEWDVDTFTCGLAASDETFIDHYHWEPFRETWKVGSNRTRSGRPICFSVKPDNSVIFDCLPDAAYIIRGEYASTPASVGADADSPNFPAQHHLAIVYRAMMFSGAYGAEPDKFAFGESEYKKIMSRMESALLPRMESGAPLA